MRAAQIHLPMPYEDDGDEEDWDEELEDEDGWDTSEWEDQELPDPKSEDEQYQGVNRPPPAADEPGQPPRRKKRRRHPPMPRVPKPAEADVWEPPFEVLPDGTVTGPTIGDGDATRLPEGFDPPRGSFEGVTSIFRPPGSSGGENMPRT